MADSIDNHSINVELEYFGVRTDVDVVTLDVVKKIIDDFKHEKCLHKCYAYQIVLQAREILRALLLLVDISILYGNHFIVCVIVYGLFYGLLNIF